MTEKERKEGRKEDRERERELKGDRDTPSLPTWLPWLGLGQAKTWR